MKKPDHSDYLQRCLELNVNKKCTLKCILNTHTHIYLYKYLDISV